MIGKKLFFEEAKKCGLEDQELIDKLYIFARDVICHNLIESGRDIQLDADEAVAVNFLLAKFGLSLTLSKNYYSYRDAYSEKIRFVVC